MKEVCAHCVVVPVAMCVHQEVVPPQVEAMYTYMHARACPHARAYKIMHAHAREHMPVHTYKRTHMHKHTCPFIHANGWLSGVYG